MANGKYKWDHVHLKSTNYILIILRIKFTSLNMACNVLYGLLHCSFSDLSSFHSLPCSLCPGLDCIEPFKLISTLQPCQFLLLIPEKLCLQLFMNLVPLLNSSFFVKISSQRTPLALFNWLPSMLHSVTIMTLLSETTLFFYHLVIGLCPPALPLPHWL